MDICTHVIHTLHTASLPIVLVQNWRFQREECPGSLNADGVWRGQLTASKRVIHLRRKNMVNIIRLHYPPQ